MDIPINNNTASTGDKSQVIQVIGNNYGNISIEIGSSKPAMFLIDKIRKRLIEINRSEKWFLSVLSKRTPHNAKKLYNLNSHEAELAILVIAEYAPSRTTLKITEIINMAERHGYCEDWILNVARQLFDLKSRSTRKNHTIPPTLNSLTPEQTSQLRTFIFKFLDSK